MIKTPEKIDTAWAAALPAALMPRLARSAAFFLVMMASFGAIAAEAATWDTIVRTMPGHIVESPGSVEAGGSQPVSDAILVRFDPAGADACGELRCPPRKPVAVVDPDPASILDSVVPDTDFQAPVTFGPGAP